MDYEQKYKEALEIIKGNLNALNEIAQTGAETVNIQSIKNCFYRAFPVLKESEDERIRKELLESFKYQQRESCTDKEWLNGIKLSEVVAWLEKQGKENMIEALRLEYEKGKADALSEQRKEWTAEDLLNRNEIADILQEYNRDDLINWLEKQGANSATITNGNTSVTNAEVVSHLTVTDSDGGKCTTASTTIEPRFKVGDFIVNDYCMGRVIELTNDAYLLDTEQGIPFSCEHNVRLWAIQDAKDGDIIYIKRYKTNDEWLLIFKKIKIQNRFIDVYDYYAFCITSNNAYHESIGIGCWGLLADNNDIVCPATKEQCNLLFAKMKEEGLSWDAEKKDLKKISQEYPLTPDECIKPAEWSKEDERIYHSLLADIRASKNGSTNTLEAYYNEQIDWLKSLKKRLKGE